MAGYWPSSFFACLWTETKSRSINSQKKRTRPMSSHLDRANLVNKGFIIWLFGKFCLRDTEGSPERERSLDLARSGSQSQRAIWVILPARGASHILSYVICQLLFENLTQTIERFLRGLQLFKTIYLLLVFVIPLMYLFLSYAKIAFSLRGKKKQKQNYSSSCCQL